MSSPPKTSESELKKLNPKKEEEGFQVTSNLSNYRGGKNLRFGPASRTNFKRRGDTNRVRTTKYTIINYIPKSLLLQFKRAANVYFLVITILTSMPFSPKSPESMIGTFAFVLLVTMIKEGYEDWQRYKQDREVNHKEAMVFDYDTQDFEFIPWKDLEEGDLVKLNKDGPIPADLLLICSSNTDSGLAFVDTMNLDGETNLKERISIEDFKDYSLAEVSRLEGHVDYELPNENLVKWNGKVTIEAKNIQKACKLPQLMLRGSVLKNTQFCYGVVVYSGHDTKIMKNAKKPPSKSSNVLKKMNFLLYSVFAFQAVLCLSFAVASIVWQNSNADKHSYLGEMDIDPGNFIIKALTFWVAYSHLIPISLYVALEILKIAQAVLINWDRDLYYQPLDRRATARTSDLIEELGQVEFIFSDKTGTLTCNVMEFKKCSIHGHIYGDHPEYPLKSPKTINGDKSAYKVLQSAGRETTEKTLIYDFFGLLAVCHTVVPDKNETTQELQYQASSPDELALVEGAAQMGFKFISRTSETLTVDIMGEIIVWDVLNELPFNSARKRMSVIVRHPKTKQIILMTKGADNVMMPLLKNSQMEQDAVQNHIDDFAREGLRTLAMAQKVIPEEEYSEWKKQFVKLNLSTSDDKDESLDLLYAELELELNLVGASAIEDKLQEHVPRTIKNLMDANIRVWVLTGDKQETAIEIGKSCQLIDERMELAILSSPNQEVLRSKIERYLTSFRRDPHAEHSILPPKQLAIVIDGPTLVWALHEEVARDFLELGLIANSCICCRVSPLQKSLVVKLAKDHGNWITLAVGDGANDVSMIHEAHLGIGIMGKEGTQAVRASDYAIAQFKFLEKLLLVHGRWGYRRVCWFICYYFYKNITVVFTEFFFAIVSGFSGQIYFVEWLPMMYNAFWTSWPCLFTYTFEQDVDAKNSVQHPEIYMIGQRGSYFNFHKFWTWIIQALWHGSVCYWIPSQTMRWITGSDGELYGHWWMSTISFTLIIHVVTFKIAIESYYWNWINVVSFFGSILFYYIIVFGLSQPSVASTFQPQFHHVMNSLFSNPRFWFILILAPFVALLPDLFFNAYQKMFNPTPVDFLVSRQKDDPAGSNQREPDLNQSGQQLIEVKPSEFRSY